MIKITMIECENAAELELAMKGINSKHIIPAEPTNSPGEFVVYGEKENEVPGDEFERLMALKGYKVSSQKAKHARATFFNIKRTKRGRLWWYNLDDIKKVPTKKRYSIPNHNTP